MKRFAAADPTVPAIAVVIATCRRPALLRRCLQALLAQQGLARDWEIVVVDDGPCADTEALVQALAATCKRPRLRYARAQGTRGPAGARNTGWRSTRAPVVAFTDDDTVPAPDWLAEGLRALDDGLVAAGGRVVVPVDGPPTDHARMTQGLERAEFVTANAFVRRSALLGVGGFDTRFTRAWREDSDLQFALLERYGGVGRAERAVVVHPVRPVRWGISMAQQANVYFDALLFAKHPDLYRSRIRRHPPWLYGLIVASALGAAGAALAGQGPLAGALAALALAGCLVFALRRLRGASHAPAHVAEMLVTSLAIPFLACYWRLRGAWRFRTLFP
ncbi:glycosyltransferase family 2 protein [Pseudorhodoferax soli]|uniref:GT2 family glycosyltransferase n=1 Tax=Pseudorhodoferax soli TaxID=545864 RepID=A0A368XX75_9BURK|nr:glycosyltransferase family A protein [Pseudorhodoferax soli]RCW72485.1 GT2 family glycosyltransferase [Pseudorhodoferax soli]